MSASLQVNQSESTSINSSDGKRKENTLPVGLVRDFPTEKAAWREVDRLGLLVRINSDDSAIRTRFDSLAEYYLKADFGEDAARPKSVNAIPIVEHYVRDYLVARWGSHLASDIAPLEIQRWLKSLHTVNGLAWTTISKIRGIMHQISKVGILHERVEKNPSSMWRHVPSPLIKQSSSRQNKLLPS